MLAELASDLLASLDSAELMRRAGMEPDEWQASALRSTAPRALWNCSRQSGKSTVAAVSAVHRAIFYSNSVALVVAEDQRRSIEFVTKTRRILGDLGWPVKEVADSRQQIELENGSRIIGLPGNQAVRGYTADLLVIDEAAKVPDGTYFAAVPTLAVTGGRLLALSTPFGRRGWFYEAWANEGNLWERVRVPAEECPRITPEYLETERASKPAWHFQQEYGCEFLEAEGAVFSVDFIDSAFSDEVAPMFPGGVE